MHELVGLRVMHRTSKRKGRIIDVSNGKMRISYGDSEGTYSFPACLADTFILENEDLQNKYMQEGSDANFDQFKSLYKHAVNAEIAYLRETGGKRYRIIDGECLQTENNTYVYLFEADSELHFPDGTTIKLWLPEKIISAQVISCEEFTIIIQPIEFIGEKVETVEFTAEPWQLMEALVERIEELSAVTSPIAYELACKGYSKINQRKSIGLGQDLALKKSTMQPIMFVWGPPGTGKTTTLARIALEHILNGERVLMVSYSNVSVDGAVLKIANMSDQEPGHIIRYGYPRVKELLESGTLTSYSYVLYKNPELAEEYKTLSQERNKLKKKDPRRIEIQKKLNKIREKLLEQEKQLVQNVAFVATTVSKAVVDKTLYTQKFDVVIFDEASMAYIPQVVFAASLAKKHFCCLGDFRQLPAIVQNPVDTLLTKDIFEHTGITSAVENGYGHEWLVMLNYQYRMHPEIAKFVSKHLYGSLLQSASTIYEHSQAIADLAPKEKEPMSLVDLSSTYSVCIKTMDGSRINLMSAMICIKLAEMFAGEYGVGIITPYSAQSRLVLAMIRDLQERDKRFASVRCATVHQFQGSEQPIIIYDAVDCFRIPFPGSLLTSKKNDTANRLFNVAMTRTQGKFILVANKEYLFRKNIAKDLMFTKALKTMTNLELYIGGEDLFEELGTQEEETPEMFLGDRDEIDSWERYLDDIENASDEIFIDIPGVMDDDVDALEDFIAALVTAEENGIKIYIRVAENITLAKSLNKYRANHSYVTTPVTVIDRKIVWFGEPLSSADFISEGNIIETEYFPCLRFEGRHTARMIKALFEIPTLKKGEK